MFVRGRHFIIADVLLITLAYFLAYVIRFDLLSYPWYYRQYGLFTFALILIRLPIFYYFGLYRRLWRYASVRELIAIVIAVSMGSGVVLMAVLAANLLPKEDRFLSGFPRSIIALDWLLTLVMVGGSRFAVRAVAEGRGFIQGGARSEEGARPALIVGAGDAGAALARELQNSPQVKLIAVGFVDDDPAKVNHQIRGIPVLGTRQAIPTIAMHSGAEVAIIAMPTASGKTIRETVELCQQAGLETKTVPGFYQILDGRVSVKSLRTVEVGDLLRRESKFADLNLPTDYLTGRRVLVTGAGGSIGSELCRQIAHYTPDLLILLGHGENSIFEVNEELARRFPDLPTRPVIADVRNRDRLMRVFDRYAPDVVFHAAAHKHVPLMEENPIEAVTNNVFGTANVFAACEARRVPRCVLVSTDKAVRPANVMGATKRLAELLLLDAARRTGLIYVAVRFGNVLGSRGSVVPLFQKQIAEGGPVTVTHPDMKRYFMTIPEAVQLILRAGAIGRGGEIFVLDMGEQVRIVDLATDLIRLSGLEAGKDIDIKFTGVRPGEKLEEELFLSSEAYAATADERIIVLQDASVGPGGALPDDFAARVTELAAFANAGDESAVVTALNRLAAVIPSR